VGGLPRWQGRELVGGDLSAEEVRDLPDHPARGLRRPFTLELRPDAVAHVLLGAFDRLLVLLWLGGQLIYTSYF